MEGPHGVKKTNVCVCMYTIIDSRVGTLRSPGGWVRGSGAVLVQLVSTVFLLVYLCQVMHTQAT